MQEAFLFLLLILFVSLPDAKASEFRSNTYFTTIRKPGRDLVSKQQDLMGRTRLNRKVSVGVSGTYLERFDLVEKRGGALLGLKPNERLSVELGFQSGNGNNLLPETETSLQTYHMGREGLTPFFIYRDSRYSVTRLHSLNLGMEIEKIPQWVLIPTVFLGKATFNAPATTRDILSYGVRMTYFLETKYSLSIFSNRGMEASQGIIGRSTRLLDTFTGGVSCSYFILPEIKTELTFDHTDYNQIRTQFHTTMLTLTWML